MTKDEIKACILLKQQEMPFDVKDREESLPLDGRDIITIPGVRRCGKSTRMELAINGLIARDVPKENILWIGFDDERFSSMTALELDLILDAYRELYPDTPLKDVWMFFDELPLVEDWELFALRVYKSYCRHLFICGSNAHTLSKEMKSELRGWPLEFETSPLSFREFCDFKGLNRSSALESEQAKLRIGFDEFNRLGGMPFIEHFNVKNPLVLRFFLKRAMAGVSNPLSVNAIYGDIRAQGLKIAKDELYGWLEDACAIYLLLKVPKYSRSVAKQAAAQAKYYVVDNGLRNAVIPLQSDDQGKQLENTVFLELRRRLSGTETISYYQDRGECDFVIGDGENISRLVQVTWDMSGQDEAGRTTRKRELNGLLGASEALGCSDLTIITHDEEAVLTERGRTVKVIPAWKWLLHRDEIE